MRNTFIKINIPVEMILVELDFIIFRGDEINFVSSF